MQTKTARQIWEEAGKPAGPLLDAVLAEIERAEGLEASVLFMRDTVRKNLEQAGVKFDDRGNIWMDAVRDTMFVLTEQELQFLKARCRNEPDEHTPAWEKTMHERLKPFPWPGTLGHVEDRSKHTEQTNA
jgi:hypothetical protein